MQQRYYDPVIGRFYSNDPVGFTGEPDTFNRYSYVANNPYKFTDPTGEAKYKGDKSGVAATNLVAKGVVSVTDKGTPIHDFAQKVVDITDKLIYNDSGYKKHKGISRETAKGVASKKPKDGQAALDNSAPLGGNSKARIGVDVENAEVVILKSNGTPANEYHGYVPERLTSKEAKAAKKAFDGLLKIDNKGACEICSRIDRK